MKKRAVRFMFLIGTWLYFLIALYLIYNNISLTNFPSLETCLHAILIMILGSTYYYTEGYHRGLWEGAQAINNIVGEANNRWLNTLKPYIGDKWENTINIEDDDA